MRRTALPLTVIALTSLLVPISAADGSPVQPQPQLWLVDRDGSNERKIGGVGSPSHIDWSPVGDKFLTGSSDILLHDISDDTVKSLTDTDRIYEQSPAWSPDGNQIAFKSDNEEGSDLYVMDSDGSDLRRLTNEDGSVSSPTWSPDGRSLAFVRYIDGTTEREVWVLDLDNAESRRVSAGAGPAWSADSDRLVYITADRGVEIVNADGTGVRTLLAPNERSGPWASRLLLGQHETVLCDCGSMIEIDPETGQTSNLGPGWGVDRSADGSLTFVKDGSVVVRETDGTEIQVTDPEPPPGSASLSDGSPRWSFDGRTISFIRQETYECGSYCYPPPPQCGDGVDNDGDGKRDGKDPGCSDHDRWSEETYGHAKTWMRYSAEGFRGRFVAVRDKPPRPCVARRVVKLKEFGANGTVVWRGRSDDSGRWRIKGPERPAGRFTVEASARRFVRRDGEEVVCADTWTKPLPVFVDSPILHPYCRNEPATVAGTDAADELIGTDSKDVFVAFGGGDRVQGLGESDLVCAGDGNDTVEGGDHADTLWGEDGNDTLLGGDETVVNSGDTLIPGPGDDMIDGGAGKDQLYFITATEGLRLDLSRGSSDGDGHDSIVNVEAFTGTSYADVMSGDDSAQTFYGGAGNDVLAGSGGDDVIFAGDGDDDIDGGAGRDYLYGDTGSDSCTAGERSYSCLEP